MGGSYSSDLFMGGMPEWAKKLKDACQLIQEVEREVGEIIGEDGQYDNAAEDGALRERLGIARHLIETTMREK